MRALLIALTGAWLAFTAPADAAPPQCQLVKYLELPVQIAGRRAIVTARINGKDARFILDSGAFFSNLSRASAVEFGLTAIAAPPRLHLRGITGEASVEMTTVSNFELGGVKLPQVDFLVAGSDTGTAGLLGQNFLGAFDVEYDLPHGMIRLFRAKNCPDGQAAYWSAGRPVTMVRLVPRDPPRQVHTMGTITLNTTKLTAVFDSGAQSSILTTAAARRAGITRESLGVTAAGFSSGLGSRTIPSWMGTFDRIDIGGEVIPRPKIRFGDVQFGYGDILIGFDFFLTHRILVLNSAARMFVTYEGGTVFGLSPTGVRDADGAPIAAAPKEDAPKDADGLARRGAVEVADRNFDAAFADFDAAVALAPTDAPYPKMRANARLANRQPLLAMSDFEKAIALDPNDPETRQGRASLRLMSRDAKGAREDLQAMDRLYPPSANQRLTLGSMYGAIDEYDAAIASFDLWLKYHPEDAARPVALNGRCWTRALANRELDKALGDCNAAIRARPNAAAYFDSRALVRLRRGEWALAKADYDTALVTLTRNAFALYGRSIARRNLGDGAGADADRAAAMALQPTVAERAKKLRLES